MSRIRMFVCLSLIALPIALVAAPAHAVQLISNGDFETGDLSGWTTFTTSANATLGVGYPQVVMFDTNNNGTDSLAAAFRPGEIQYTGAPEGGGIYQDFNMANPGALSVRVNVAMLDDIGGDNVDGGLVELMIDGVVVDSVDFEYADVGVTEYALLANVSIETAGTHEIRIRMTRVYEESYQSPVIYLDDIIVCARDPQDPVPEPATVMLLGAGIAGLAAARRRRKA